jgi:hypothetical protein
MFRIAAGLLIPPTVAVIAELPALRPVARPEPEPEPIVATEVFVETQVTAAVRLCVLPSL